ncbi:MAG TPA: toll/interleukin-1 receptor domain-containing protein [Roseiarcus sp.]|nr:toll/interleukin-1 receptor domain-containing protein [Roseiarcus sp.]
MSYLAPPFDPDVFVSYSHGDPIEGVGLLRDWTRDLIQRLGARLHSLETEFDDLNLWIDVKLDPTADLTPDLKEKAGGCGVLLIVMSKRYLKSEWCEKEREWFRQQVDARALQAGRVFLVQAQKTDPKLWPEFLLDSDGKARMTGFSFFDPTDGSPLGFQLREPPDEYYKQLAVLHTWLVTRLRELRERAAKEAEAKSAAAAMTTPAQAASTARRIYLYAPPQSEPVRGQVEVDLRGEGFDPLTAEPVGGDGPAAWQREAKVRIELASRCEALALLRADGDERFLGDLLDVGVDERKRIVGVRGGSLPCAVLDRSGEALPINVARYDIERFDINRSDWLGAFRAWFASRAAPAGAAS